MIIHSEPLNNVTISQTQVQANEALQSRIICYMKAMSTAVINCPQIFPVGKSLAEDPLSPE